jgi:poly-beta-1,6-N-acetyl-D-glucosamine synthase
MLFVSIILGSYCLLVLGLIYGWHRALSAPKQGIQKLHRISVVIAVRNESANIQKLIDSLKLQTYQNFEVVMVDDHSDDNTRALIAENLAGNMTVFGNQFEGKKGAITTGVKNAAGEIIVTTDADCKFNPEWIDEINRAFQSDSVMMAIGAVKIKVADFFSAMQCVEFSTLVGSGFATLGFQIPTMCNGANLAYRKIVFEAVNGYEGNLQISSGDDEFLMRKIEAQFPRSIHVLKDKKSVVETNAQPTLSSFVGQRIRWAGKWKLNTSFFSVVLAAYIFTVQLCVIIGIGSLFFTASISFVMLVAVKIVFECIFILQVFRFCNAKWRTLPFLVVQIIYPVYVVLIAITSTFSKSSWKGRPVKL